MKTHQSNVRIINRDKVIEAIQRGRAKDIKFIKGEIFVNCDFNNSDFKGVDLRGVEFLRCEFNGADFTMANLERVELGHCEFICANFTRAFLKGANPNHSNFKGANLKEASLDGCGLWEVIGNDKEIKNIEIEGCHELITYTHNVLQIGYYSFSFKEWQDFTDEEIKEIDEDILDFWKRNKDSIFKTIENNPAVEP